MTYTNQQKSKAKYQIKKILEKTEANGCTAEEAASALMKAKAMMAKFGLEPATFGLVEEKAPKAKKEKAPKAEKVSSGKRGPAPQYKDDQVIVKVVPNPKRPETKAWIRFNAYKEGMTIAEAVAAGLTRDDFRWDVKHNHIEIK